MSDNDSRTQRQIDIDNRSRDYRETPGGIIHEYDSDRPVVADTYDTVQMQEHFKVLAFSAPFVQVIRKSDGKLGTLEFKHSPRVYFNFQES